VWTCAATAALIAEAFLRVDTPATTYETLTNNLNLPQQLVLLRSAPKASGCTLPTAITKIASLIGKVVVLQILADCMDSLYEDGVFSRRATKLWEAYAVPRIMLVE
jgi:hypothetical protein